MEFSVKIPKEKPRQKAMLEKAKREGKKEGITVTGDLDEGTFTGGGMLGKIEGTYKVSGTNLKVEVTKKPFMLGERMLQKVISEFFEE